MDPKLAYWTGALVNLAAVVLCALLGVRQIRRRNFHAHRRLMWLAICGVGLFLVSYALKLLTLGREERSAWTALDLAVLYIHELCIAAMLLSGVFAVRRALSFQASLGPGPRLPADLAPSRARKHHRLAGRIAVVAGVLAVATASAILVGMYARSQSG